MTIRMRDSVVRVPFSCVGETMTKQSLAYEADVNVIVAKYVKTGDPAIFRQRAGEFLDTTSVGDYFSCLNRVKEAEEAFLTLPSKVRDQFGNDPGKLEAAMRDPGQREALVSAGILAKAVPVPTVATSPGPTSSAVPAVSASGTPSTSTGTTAGSSTS